MELVFDVKSPILGFENLQKVELKKIDDFFASIRGLDESGTSFTVVNPYAFREYSFDLPVTTKVLLDVHAESKLEIYNIVVVQNPIEKSLINFVSPLVFNYDNMTIGQVVLDHLQYPSFGFAEELSKFLK